MTKKRTSPKHESIACLESKKQYCIHILGHSPTAFALRLTTDQYTEKKNFEIAQVLTPFLLNLLP